ncbi:MAG: hypothetical protein V7767_09430, partial [Leeuwenhoekiella sp.]
MKTIIQLKLMVSFLLICALSTAFGQDNKEASLNDKLYEEYKEKGVDAALETYYKMADKDDEYTGMSEPLNQLGYQILMEAKDTDAAEKVFLAQIQAYPNEANPLDSYGEILMNKGENEKAKEYFMKSVAVIEAMDDPSEAKDILIASKSNLAKLNGKTAVFDFVEGNWNMEIYDIVDGIKAPPYNGSMKWSYNDDNTIITGKMHDTQGTYRGSRIIAYNALDDVYDLAYARSGVYAGLQPSTLTIKENSPQKVVFLESYEEDGKDKKARHTITKKDEMIDWSVNELDDNDSEKP